MKSRRSILLVTALSVAVVLTAWTVITDRSSLVLSSSQPRVTPGGAPTPIPGIQSAPSVRPLLSDALSDPFATRSVLPPAAVSTPAPIAQIAQKPSAPKFPFQYFGRLSNVDGQSVTYLTRDKSLIPVHEQQILDNEYRVDSITDKQILVTYLPLNEQTAISIQSAAK